MNGKPVFKKIIISFIFFLATAFFVSAGGEQEETDLVIYAYDSFTAEWGPGPQLIPLFEEQTGYTVNLISAGDAGQVLSRAIIEKDDPRADLIIGIDNNLLARALEEDVLSPYKSTELSYVPREFHFDDSYRIIPFDHGYFSIIYDSATILDPPASLEDLTKPEFAQSLILMDPRTSSPGLGFLLWTIHEYGSDYTSYWKRLAGSVLTITEGWDAGYGLFTAGEAPMVLSYTTSPAYHLEYEDSDRYKAAIFTGGNYMQIEGMGIVKNAKNREAAERFVDFLLSEEAQGVLPLTNWMFPVRDSVSLPGSFSGAVNPKQKLIHSSEEIKAHYEEWITGWIDSLGNSRK
jgi:thiamine transport system substrate-binding protein